MAVLKIWCSRHRRVEKELEVQDVTTMGYAALHVAEAVGLNPGAERWTLYTRGDQPIDAGDLAAQWDGQEVVLHTHREPR